MSWSDKRFLTKAAEDGHAEVQLAQLAADRTTNAEVRTFAQKIVSAHTAANATLGTLASSKMVELDKDEGQDRFYRRLSKMSGADFDREFVEHMVDAHEKNVKMFEKASTDAKDMEVRNFASTQLVHLRDHQQQAQSLQRSTMSSGRTDGTNASGSYNRTPGLNGSTSTSPNSSSTGTDATGTTPGSATASPSDSSTRGSNPTGGSSSTDRGTSPGTDPIRR